MTEPNPSPGNPSPSGRPRAVAPPKAVPPTADETTETVTRSRTKKIPPRAPSKRRPTTASGSSVAAFNQIVASMKIMSDNDTERTKHIGTLVDTVVSQQSQTAEIFTKGFADLGAKIDATSDKALKAEEDRQNKAKKAEEERIADAADAPPTKVEVIKQPVKSDPMGFFRFVALLIILVFLCGICYSLWHAAPATSGTSSQSSASPMTPNPTTNPNLVDTNRDSGQTKIKTDEHPFPHFLNGDGVGKIVDDKIAAYDITSNKRLDKAIGDLRTNLHREIGKSAADTLHACDLKIEAGNKETRRSIERSMDRWKAEVEEQLRKNRLQNVQSQNVGSSSSTSGPDVEPNTVTVTWDKDIRLYNVAGKFQMLIAKVHVADIIPGSESVSYVTNGLVQEWYQPYLLSYQYPEGFNVMGTVVCTEGSETREIIDLPPNSVYHGPGGGLYYIADGQMVTAPPGCEYILRRISR